MKQFYLAEIVTKDKLIHQGIFFRPSRKPSSAKASAGKAILWVHGLGSTFYGNVALFEAFSNACEKHGFGFASFNNRGHDGITGLKKIDSESEKGYSRLTGGAGTEVFEECVYDIDAGVAFLVQQGFEHVIVAGHSTGANKACYYGALTKNSRAAGIILLSPLSDRLNPQGRSPRWVVPLAKFLMLIGRGNMLIPVGHYPGTPKRLLSLMGRGSNEDTFDYGDPDPKMTSFSRIVKPLFVIFAGADELADRPIKEIQMIFDQHGPKKNYQSVIIPGAFHSFNGKEEEIAGTILRWAREL